ncbi:hypothetical protein L0152_31380 [bacterium]|nr:hypothetical protein [bacterium]
MRSKTILICLGFFFFLELQYRADVFAFIRIDADGTDVNLLMRDLQRITGLELYVQRGYVRTGFQIQQTIIPGSKVISPIPFRGSETARNLFLSALQSTNVYKIRIDRDANLGRVFKGDLIELDLMDQKYLRFRGVPPEVFNTSMIFFHELIHRHLALPDPNLTEILKDRNVRGKTVEFMNRIERELNLPERSHYFPRKNPVPGSSGFCIFFGSDGKRIEIDSEMFRPLFQSGKNQGYVGLLRK